jgi:hypothetical protein
MVRNIISAVILAIIVVPSWQIGSIIIEKQSVTFMLQEKANSIRRYHRVETVQNNLKKELELKGLHTGSTFEAMEGGKIKINYQYYGAATVFGYTYYQTTETFSAVTTDSDKLSF